jgi:oxygen-dependent protoporphyrinogen oxidase
MSGQEFARKRVAVLGAGVGGLTAARLLMRQPDVAVTLYERAERAGGVVHTSRVDGFVREHAANGFLPARDEYTAIDLARELGVDMIEAGLAAKKRWIYRHGRLHALPSSPLSFASTRLLSLRGKLEIFAEPLRPRGAGDDESIHAFVSRRLGREVADAVIAPMVTGIFGGDARAISVQAGFPSLGALEQKGGLIVGGVRTMLERLKARRADQAAGQAGGDAAAPKKRGRLSAPRLGVGALIDALVAEVEGALVLGREVTRVTRGPELHFADGSSERFDSVVLATPAHVSAALVEAAHPALAEVLAEIPYAPIVVVHLGVDRSHIDHPLDGFGFLVAEHEDLRMLGTVFESVVYEDRAPAGHALLRCMFGGARDPAAVELSDEALIAQARADLDRALGGFADVRLSHENVVKWPRAIAQYTVGHAERVDRAEQLASPAGLILAGSAYHGVAINKIVADAERVTRAVLGNLGMAASREPDHEESA